MKKRSERIKEKKEAEKKRHYNELRKTATKGVAMLSVGVALNSVLTSGSIILAANSTSQSKTRYHSNDFLNKLLPDAQNIANDKGLYTSVMLAQAVLESGWGTSKLSKDPYNNLFGIKARPGEDSVDMNTLEDDGTGNYYTIVDGFRVYPSYKESLTDYANFLTGDNGKDQWRYNNYAGVRRENTKTYQDATKALYDANYATDTSYTSKLNTIIESNNLTDFDGDYTPTYTDNSGSNNTATSNSGTYKVVKGDGFYAIERKTGVAVDQILAANGF
ncbi:glucosaminidase domain-containing protein, partial [Bavariicoccus seileri]|uniref:glucosaminidase domain-containing protein n=2 Tax=Bavariicoccus seileri TaxID=549685 RepID=UPI0003B476E9